MIIPNDDSLSFNSSFDSEGSTSQDNEDDIILTPVISPELEHLITSINDTLLKVTVQHHHERSPFYSSVIPSISLLDYLRRIVLYSNIEPSTLIISLIYLDRISNSKITLSKHNIHRLLFTSILLAIKYNEDAYYKSDYYAKIAGVSLKEMNKMEECFVKLINFYLFVSGNLYEKYSAGLKVQNPSLLYVTNYKKKKPYK